MDVCLLRRLICGLLTAVTLADDTGVTFVSELSSRPAQKLSKYGWYGSVRLQRFNVPEETAVARWQFSVTRTQGFQCGQHDVTIYIRWGAPPVINPLDLVFPNATLWSPALSVTLAVTSYNSTTFNLSDPAPGDWYVAAHLPQDDGRIEQKGLPSCTYVFQPQLSIRRAVDTPILQQATPLLQTASPDRPARLRLFVPEFASSLSVSVSDCSLGEVPRNGSCSLVLRLGSSSPREGPLTSNCSGRDCSATLSAPPWDTWMWVVVETDAGDNRTVAFTITANYTVGCKPQNVGLSGDYYFPELRGNATSPGNSSLASTPNDLPPPEPSGRGCVWDVPVLSEELDVLSIRFTPAKGPGVNLTLGRPALLTYPVHTHASGGTLNLQLTLNTTKAALGNSSSVVACLSPRAPVLSLNHSRLCSPGYGLRLNDTVPKATLRLPFPEAATWYLTLQLTCNSSNCSNASLVAVTAEVSISGCVDDCGPHGECRLLRASSFLYSGCACRAGWGGWGCTDDSTALSWGRQLTALLLLTLSNLMFLPAIAVALHRCYVPEASVYFFTMLFSTFYHACDQPGTLKLCIMDYSTLQFCDFLGAISSFLVTILCMARLPDLFKYTLNMFGVLLLSMLVFSDRTGLWNMLGPILCAAVVMLTAWVYRGARRRHCYPSPWQRWVFFLLPGTSCALIGVCIFLFAETDANYYYTHSLWHMLVAASVLLLLPPREPRWKPWGWARGWGCGWGCGWGRAWSWTPPRECGYLVCQGSSKDELYAVT